MSQGGTSRQRYTVEYVEDPAGSVEISLRSSRRHFNQVRVRFGITRCYKVVHIEPSVLVQRAGFLHLRLVTTLSRRTYNGPEFTHIMSGHISAELVA